MTPAVIFSDVRLGESLGRKSGGRVELRPHDPTFFPLYERWYADPEIWSLSSWRPGPMSPDETRKLFEDRKLSGTEESYAIHLSDSRSIAPIGVIGLMNVGGSDRSADLSIIIGDPEYRGYGYGTEAIMAMLAFGFESLELDRIALSVFDFNEPAISTYAKLGFSEEGSIKRAVHRDDGYHDAILMGIYRDEWESLHRNEDVL